MKRALTSGLVFGSGSAIFTSMDLGKELPPGVCRIYCRGLSIADESAWYIMALIVCWLVTKSCLTLSNPMDCSLPGSSVHGIFQARVLEWGAIAFSTNPCYITYFLIANFTLNNIYRTYGHILFNTPLSAMNR